jgi:hypothetical protein
MIIIRSIEAGVDVNSISIQSDTTLIGMMRVCYLKVNLRYDGHIE